MKIVCLGCGGQRPQSPEWVNLDDLHSQLPPGSGARQQLDAEPNYINHVLLSSPLPFADGTVDGILASHLIEHFTVQDAIKLMQDCVRVLKPGGVLLVSVPDASYFRRVHDLDCNANWPDLFDVSDPPNPIPTFRAAALYFEQHYQVLSEDVLWNHFVQAGFLADNVHRLAPMDKHIPAMGEMMPHLNRRKFSLEMWAQKD